MTSGPAITPVSAALMDLSRQLVISLLPMWLQVEMQAQTLKDENAAAAKRSPRTVPRQLGNANGNGNGSTDDVKSLHAKAKQKARSQQAPSRLLEFRVPAKQVAAVRRRFAGLEVRPRSCARPLTSVCVSARSSRTRSSSKRATA